MSPKQNATIHALMAHGLAVDIAERLLRESFSLKVLKSKSLKQLISLGIPQKVAENITSKRTPIPNKTLLKLLHDNKWVCCICRNPDWPIVVHHIEEWSKSRSHAITNLVVLCPNHHASAHMQSEISQSLSKEKLFDAKIRWEKKVKKDDSTVIREATQNVGENWYFFNVLRLEEIARHQRIDLKKLNSYRFARTSGILDADDTLILKNSLSTYAYDGSNVRLQYRYMKDLLLCILEKATIDNVSDRLDRSDIGRMLVKNDLIYVGGAHTFRQINDIKSGPCQMVEGIRSANSVRIVFILDRWYATSSSAHSQWLSGRVAVGSICRVGDIARQDGKVIIKCSVLAVCEELPNLKNRSYLSESVYPHIQRTRHIEDDTPEEDEVDMETEADTIYPNDFDDF